jgi:pyrroloquinoline quinone biosynthesis protein B
VILNASPDLPAQIRAAPFLQPREAPRSSPISAVALTGAEVDVVAGLLSLREGHAFGLYATAAVHAALDANPIFEALARSRVARPALAPGERAELPGGLTLELFPVAGKAPLYRPDGAAEGMASAAEIGDGRRRVVFAPSFARLSPDLAARVAAADVAFFDASFWSEDEIVALTGKTASAMGHLPLSGPDGSLAALAALPGRKILIHMNHSNPVLLADSPERAEVERDGFEIAFDGMEVAL